MYYVIIKDYIYYGCFVHNHICMNKLLRKIVFTDMAIRNKPEHLINNTGLAVCTQKIGTQYFGFGNLHEKNPGRNNTWLAV